MIEVIADTIQQLPDLYRPVVDFMVRSGDELPPRAGNIADIGQKKIWLTEDDLRIERGLKNIINGFGAGHAVYAEEENDEVKTAQNVWVIDPISGTHNYIAGVPGYALVLSHLQNNEWRFAAVYHPPTRELYIAIAGKGAFLNGKRIYVRQPSTTPEVIVRTSKLWKDQNMKDKLAPMLSGYSTSVNQLSMGLNYCMVASGQADGIIAFTKDSFPEFAGSLMIKEAGGKFANFMGEEKFKYSDRIFAGGSPAVYERLIGITRESAKL